MWTCDNCGEQENEGNFSFCIACGTPRPVAGEVQPKGTDIDMAFKTFVAELPTAGTLSAEPQPSFADYDSPTRTPMLSIGHRIKAVFTRGSSKTLTVRLSPFGEEKLEQLVRAGVFPEMSDAAAYLLDEGIKSQTRLFEVVEQKLSEIERLRAELRHLVHKKPL